ncbi:unnamed protein product [Symbiodinium sp. CCMP2592]|nr:unnamed protein product [Symbiodinium sp. CCMP2592]
MAAFFDDDLIDFDHEADFGTDAEGEGAAGAETGDYDDQNGSLGAGADSNDEDADLGGGSVGTLPGSNGVRRRKRGSRGGAKVAQQAMDSSKRWRSGAVPSVPTFDGDIEANPYCLRHYRRRLMRWVRITKEFLPANEQALRALEQLRGEAEQEFEEVDDARFDHPDGIGRLLADLEVSFGEREIFRQGGTIREFENIGRLQGESITAFVRRFRLLERKLADNKVPAYPEQALVIKLLDGLKIDERATSALLLAAGNKYDMRAILEAIRIQFPPGMSDFGELEGDENYGDPNEEWAEEADLYVDDTIEETGDGEVENEAPATEHPDGADEGADDYSHDYDNAQQEFEALISAANALTVTSKKLATIAQARGYYAVEGKGKSKKGGNPPKGKGKGKGKGKSKGKPFAKGPPKGQGKATGADAQKQARLRGALCLGCGSSEHWVRDCPTTSVYQAQLASVDVELDPEGFPTVAWMVSAEAATNHVDASFLIADTGCQRQVAGSAWHAQKASEILPLERLFAPQNCKFSFGPGPGLQSLGRYTYPAGIAGHCVMLSVSEVEVSAPGLLSRRALETLGAVPDLVAGEVVFKALNGSKTKLYLSPCGPPDVWCPGAFLPKHVKLENLSTNSSALLVHLIEFMTSVQNTVLHYSAISLRPALKDSILRIFALPSTAATMLSTPAAMAAQRAMGQDKYLKTPDNCNHPSGLRGYAASGMKIMICDVCGYRAVVNPVTGAHLPATPNATPSSKTPLNLSANAKAKVLPGKAKGPIPAPPPRASRDFLQPSSASSQGYGPSRAAGPKFLPKPKARTSQVTAQYFEMNSDAGRPRQWRASSRAGSDSEHMSVTSEPPPDPPFRSWREQRAHWGQVSEGMFGQDTVSPALGLEPEDWTLNDWEQNIAEAEETGEAQLFDEEEDEDGGGVLNGLLQGSPDEPLSSEDRGCFVLRQGVRKRLRGASKVLHSAWESEAKIYETRAKASRRLRLHKADLVEIHDGPFHVSEEAIRLGLKTLQPLTTKAIVRGDLTTQRAALLRWKPFLVIWKVPVNAPARDLLQAWLGLLSELYENHRVHFLVGGWDRLDTQSQELLTRIGSRTSSSPTTSNSSWHSSLPELSEHSASGDCHREPSASGDCHREPPASLMYESKKILYGITEALHRLGDERFCANRGPWSSSIDQWDLWHSEVDNQDHYLSYFLDVTRHEDSWSPLLKEAETRLRDMVSTAVTLKPSPFLEQIKALVPWDLKRVQISRTPKQRRAPTDLVAEGVKHRGAALLMNDSTVIIEAETMRSIVHAPSSRFDKPVQVAIFFYGNAPDTSLNPVENSRPEPPRDPRQQRAEEPEDAETMQPHQAGCRDISFPGAQDVPRWLCNVLRRLHTNLGHPAKETLVRQLVLSGASSLAVKGARCLQCEVCRRVQPPREPRPARAFTPRRFNDRLYMDILFLKDVQGTVYGYLSCVDDATCYHSVQYLPDRQEMTVIQTLMNGWYSFFGAPDELVLDAEGAFRGLRFEVLQIQCGTKLRCVPAAMLTGNSAAPNVMDKRSDMFVPGWCRNLLRLLWRR